MGATYPHTQPQRYASLCRRSVQRLMRHRSSRRSVNVSGRGSEVITPWPGTDAVRRSFVGSTGEPCGKNPNEHTHKQAPALCAPADQLLDSHLVLPERGPCRCSGVSGLPHSAC